jgi:hypothetical protein
MVSPLPKLGRLVLLLILTASAAVSMASAQSISFTPTWVQQSPSTSPLAREFSTMAYDAATGQVVLFGGDNGSGVILSDTWTWNGTTWTQQSPSTSPSARIASTMAYDAATGQVVLFGGDNGNFNSGILSDTWTWNGMTWTQQSPSASPPSRYLSSMAYDAATGQVVLFGGDHSGTPGDTWTWNGTTWTQQSPSTRPQALTTSTMAYDAATEQVVLFGGIDNNVLRDTWTWNGTDWAQQSPSTSPPARGFSTMAYDAATEQVVLFGGYNGNGNLGDTWTWNGTTWTQQSPSTSPPEREFSTMAYDAATGQVVLFGGLGDANVLNDTWTLQLGPPNLGTANVCPNGTAPAPCSQTATVNFTVGSAAVTVAHVNVLTQGAPNLDFTSTATTCSGALTANSTCTVTVKFAPRSPGARYGGITLTDSSGNILGSTLLSGTGNGPQVVFNAPLTSSTLGGGFNEPDSVAVDGSGNVYVADGGHSAVKMIPAGCTSSSCVTTRGGGFSYPEGVAVDGGGNIYVTDYYNGAVKVMANTCTASNCVTTLGGGFYQPIGVAVDGSGNVYVADGGHSAVKMIPAGCTSSSCVTTLGGGFSYPEGVAVDGGGNVYVADYSNGAVKVMANTCTSSSCVTALGGGFGNPAGVALDGSGNVYVADQTNSAVEVLANTCMSSSCVSTLGSGFNNPYGVAVDGGGNVYVADTYNNAVKEMVRATPPTVAFAHATNDGTTDTTDGTQTVTLQNIGNQPLVFAIPTAAGTTNPTTAPDFTFTTTSSSACPPLTTSAQSTATLAAGASCNVPLTFTPVTPSGGALSESLIFTDTNLNASAATQAIALTGTATVPAPTVTGISPTQGNLLGGTSVTITGTGFTSSSTVTFGSAAATNVLVNSATSITVMSPPGLGTVDVTVTTAGGTSATSAADQFTYIASVATVNSTVAVSPSPAVAGSIVTVTATLKDSSGNAINNATASFRSTSSTATFGTPSVSGNVISATMTDTAVETAPITITLGGAASGILSGSEKFVTPVYTVTVATDPSSGNGTPANCIDPNISASGNTNCSLRDAVAAANALTGVTTNINFATPLFSSAHTVLIAQSTPITINASMNINGPGANLLTIEGGTTPLSTANHQVLQQTSGDVLLSGVAVANGYSSNWGGGMYQTNGTLTVTSSAFTGNLATYGGAIDYSGSLSVLDSTFNGNRASNEGGAISSQAQGSTGSFVEDTFTANQANAGGAFSFLAANATILNSTFVANNAGEGTAIDCDDYDATLNSQGNIFANNTPTSDPFIVALQDGTGATVHSDHDLYFGGDTCSACATVTNKIAADPKLSALGYYGGPTQTLLPLPGSAAICAGTQPTLNNVPLTFDQRGVSISPTRYGQSACYDVGAVQTRYAMTGPLTLPSLVSPGSAVSPSPTVSLTEDGTPFTAGAATVTLTDTQSDIGSGNSATNSLTSGIVTFNSLQFTTAEVADQLTATLALNPTTPVSLTVNSNSFQVGQLTPVFGFTPLPSSQTYGTAIAAGSLDATATYGSNAVAGSFTYTATSNTTQTTVALTPGTTVLPAGAYTLTATFTPTNTALYKSGLTATAPYTVGQATPVIQWSNPAAITYGTALSATQLSATVTGVGGTTVPGTLTYNPNSGTVLNAGPNQTLSVGFVPTDTTDYTSTASASVTLTVNQAQPSLSFSAVPQHTYGDAPFTVSASSASSGGVSYNLISGHATVGVSSGLITLSGAGAVQLSASQVATTNYLAATATTQFPVLQQASSTALALSAASITPLQTISLTAQVAPTVTGSTTPIGTVIFYDGSTAPATPLSGAVPLLNGQAQLNGVALQSGPHVLYATYSSDANYLASTSFISTATMVTVAAEDFTFNATGSASQSVIPGSAGVFTFSVAPLYDKYPGAVTFTVTGLPAGATYIVSPSSIATNAGPQTITVSIQTLPALARMRLREPVWMMALLLPLAFSRRARKRPMRTILPMLLLFIGLWGLSGCGSGTSVNGYFGQPVKNYAITITGASGNVTHTTTVTLQVQ